MKNIKDYGLCIINIFMVGILLIFFVIPAMMGKPVVKDQVTEPAVVTVASTSKSIVPTATSTIKIKKVSKKTIRELPGEITGRDLTRENIFNIINQERYNVGIPVLKMNNVLNAAAEVKLKDMIQNSYFSHTSPNGWMPWNWMHSVGYEYKYSGENLAINFMDVQDLDTAWMNSPTHKENILKVGYTETGIAVSGTIVVQMFASPLNK